MDLVLSRFKEAGLTMSAWKMKLAMEEMEVVGTIVNHYGRRLPEKKIKKIQNWGVPCRIQELCGFLALVNLSATYILHIATMAEPLIALTREKSLTSDKLIEWNNKTKRAFK